MEILSTPRFVLAGTGEGVGASLIGIGLAIALRKRNVSLSCCVVEPHLALANIYRRVSGRTTGCLDSGLLDRTQLQRVLFQAGVGADLLMVQGKGGLFNARRAGSLEGSAAEIAGLAGCPAVVAVDLRGLGANIAALVAGFASACEGFALAGVIGNRVNPEPQRRDHSFYAACLKSKGLPPLLGALTETKTTLTTPPAFFTEHSSGISVPRQFFVEVAEAVSRSVDVDRLLELAANVTAVWLGGHQYSPSGRRTRIAVSDDSCFNLSFQDNLDLLRYYGCEPVAFSPLADLKLPEDVGGVYLTGAYLMEYAADLGRNESMRTALIDYAKSGGMIYAEGAGAAYLCRTFGDEREQKLHPGVGLIPADARAGDFNLSYAQAVTTEETILGPAGASCRGIVTGEWKIKGSERLLTTMHVSTGASPTFWKDGFSPGAQMVATTHFWHWGSNPEIAKNIAEACGVGYTVR